MSIWLFAGLLAWSVVGIILMIAWDINEHKAKLWKQITIQFVLGGPIILGLWVVLFTIGTIKSKWKSPGKLINRWLEK